MANQETDTDRLSHDRWLEARLASLTCDPEFVPDSAKALARLRERKYARRLAVRRWIWTTTGAAAAGLALFLAPVSRACAEQPGACVQRVWGMVASTSRAPLPRAASPRV